MPVGGVIKISKMCGAFGSSLNWSVSSELYIHTVGLVLIGIEYVELRRF